MFSSFKQKKILITICVLLCTMLFSAISIIVVNAIQSRNKGNDFKYRAITTSVLDSTNKIAYLNSEFNKTYCYDPGSEYYNGEKTINGTKYTFTNNGVDYFSGKKIIKDDIYENYTTFIIEDAVGLQIFADNVWYIDHVSGDSYQGYDSARKRNFYNKTVKLGNNINIGTSESYGDFSGIGWSNHHASQNWCVAFAGVFDGCGKTVQYFNLNGLYLETFKVSEGGFIGIGATTYSYEFLGFFNAVNSSATIKNFKLNSFGVASYKPSSTDRSYVGGLVGLAYGNSSSRVKIENCAVVHFNAKFGGNDANKEYAASIVCKGYANIKNCYMRNCHESGDVTNFNHIGPFDLQDHENKDYWYNLSDTIISDCVINNYQDYYYYNLSDGQTSVTNTYVYWNPIDSYPSFGLWNSSGFTSLTKNECDFSSLSSVGPEGGESAKTWYFVGSDYNSGMPYLSCFIDWTDWVVYSSRGGSVNVELWTIPTICNSRLLLKNESPLNTFSYCGCTFVATASSGYSFDYWVVEYDAEQNVGTIQAVFEHVPINITFSACSSAGVTESSTFLINYNSRITVNVETNDNGTYKKITFTFKNSSNNDEMVVYDVGETSNYYITHNYNNSNLTSTTTITVTAHVKTYKPTFTPIEE